MKGTDQMSGFERGEGSGDRCEHEEEAQDDQNPTDSEEAELPACSTSRISVKQAVSVIEKFSEFKQWLVQEIGFGGLLKLPMIPKLNLKLSKWLMSKVCVHRRAIVISESKVLRFWAEDVGKVFGVPCGNRDVKGRDARISTESVDFIKQTLRMGQSGAHSLKAADEFLLCDITEDSSQLEKQCFQIAFVIFIIGRLLAPKTKHNYAVIDFWGAIASAENIQQYNWGEYVLQCLMDAVTKLKQDILNGVLTNNLFGCHLFLQVCDYSRGNHTKN